MNFGEKIKKLRLDLGWTQEYVANKLQISVPALSRYESGTYEPKSLSIISDFAKLYNVSTDFLLTLDVDYEEKNDFRYASYNGIDIDGLDEDEIKEINDFVKFIRNKKKNGDN